MRGSDAVRSHTALSLCVALIASLLPFRSAVAQNGAPQGSAALRIVVAQCSDATGGALPGLGKLLERSLLRSLADQPGVELIGPGNTTQPDRTVAARIIAISQSRKRGQPAEVQVVAETTDSRTGSVVYRATVRGGGFSRPGEGLTPQVERAVDEAAQQIATRVVLAEKLRGAITKVDHGVSGTIDRGSVDGIATGTELEIARDTKVVGRLRIDRAEQKTATGQLLDVPAGVEVQVGDQVRIASDPVPIVAAPGKAPHKKKGWGNWAIVAAGVLVVGAVVALVALRGSDHSVNGGQIYLVPKDRQIPADGTSSTTLTATVRDAQGNPAPNGLKVQFQTTLGIIAPARVPLTNGTATATLTSAPTSGTATITASAGGLSKTTTVEFTPAPGPGIAAHISVRADPTQIPADETSTSTITAVVTDRQRNPVPDGTIVKFSTSLGIITPASALTAGGTAEATLRSGTASGTAIVTVKVDKLVKKVDVDFLSATPAFLTVIADPVQIPADGTSTSTITATVSDAQHNPVPDGTNVNFATSLGVVGPATVGTTGGIATATLHSGKTPGTATVTVTVRDLTQTVTVTFAPTAAAHLRVEADPEQIPADGKSTSTITATVTDVQNNPVPDGTLVKFTTSLGTIGPGTVETLAGIAVATLHSGKDPGTATVTVKVETLTQQVTVEFLSAVPAFLTVVADPVQIPADGTSTSTITATVSDAQHNPVPDGTKVNFATSLGVIGPATVGTTGGIATATLHSGKEPGTATVTVKTGGLTRTVTVEFAPTAAAHLTVKADPTQIPADGKSTSTITATVTTADSGPVPDGTLVTFTTSLGFVQPSSVQTQGGVATATLHSGTDPGTATVTVKVQTLTEEVTVQFLSATPAHLTVVADPEQIPADGKSTSTITATVSDAQSNPVPDGTNVTFATSLGVIGPATVPTTNGVATATLHSGKVPGTATVTVKAGTLTRKVKVEFLTTKPAHLVLEADPTEIPADGKSTSTITATVSDAQNNPVPDGTLVKFTTSLGTIGPGTVQTQGGVATATLHSGTTVGTATVTVKVETLTEQVTVEFLSATPAHLIVTANPKQIPADGTSTSTITALVSDENHTPVPDGTPVQFTTSLGVVGPGTVQTTGGVATATLHSGTTAGTATVTVEAGALTEEVDVKFVAPPAHLTVAADPTEIKADGVSTSTITATVTDEDDNPVADGTVVTFATSLGVIGPSSVETEGGVAKATLHSGTTVGIATVTVKAGTLTREVQVTFKTP